MDAQFKTTWVPLSFTFVEYPQGDLFGQLLALYSLFPVFICIGFLTLILFKRDLHTVSFFSGLIINEAICIILKHIIKSPRPLLRDNLYVEYGMPSSHSQFSWFFTSYIVLFLIFRLKLENQGILWKSLIASFVAFNAFAICYSRIYLLYHTVYQVFVGAIIGATLGSLWFVLVHILLTPYFPLIVSLGISEWFLLKDTSLIPNVLFFEYAHARQEMRARNRKNQSIKTK